MKYPVPQHERRRIERRAQSTDLTRRTSHVIVEGETLHWKCFAKRARQLAPLASQELDDRWEHIPAGLCPCCGKPTRDVIAGTFRMLPPAQWYLK